MSIQLSPRTVRKYMPRHPPGRHARQCPVLGTAGMIEVGASLAAAATSMVAEAQQSKANASAIEKQETLQQNEIAQQTGNTESVAAKQARAARSQSIVAAGAAGINLGSNSFLASLQTTTMNQSQQEQLMNESERNSERSSAAQADSEFAKTAGPSVFGAALSTALSGASAYEGAKLTEQAGAKSVPSDKLVPAAYYGGMRDALIGDM